MSEPFTDEQIDQLTVEINQQLQVLGAEDDPLYRAGAPRSRRVERQRQAIAQATGQDAGTFLARFRAAARKDLCEQGGVLHAQWQKYRDLASKDMLKTFGGILVGLGLAGNTLIVVAVAVSVYVLYLGVEAFCAGEE
jgi:hypothetical protein